MSQKLSRLEHAVIPAFHGSLPDGHAKTFPREDSDSSGAMVARAINADVLEKWSETVKTYSADPSVIESPEIIRHITYSESVELNYSGIFTVNDSVLFMLMEAGIPLRICSINDSDDTGMMISANLPEGVTRNKAVCIAGRRNSILSTSRNTASIIRKASGKNFLGFSQCITFPANIACLAYIKCPLS